jgi:hypothetical protein
MERVSHIEKINNDFIKMNKDVEEIVENFKKNHSNKINLKIEPILNAILTSSKLRDEDIQILIDDVHVNTSVYYYMNQNVLLKLLSYISSVKTLKKLKDDIGNDKIPSVLMFKNEESTSKELTELYNLRYINLLIRYIDYLINLFI